MFHLPDNTADNLHYAITKCLYINSWQEKEKSDIYYLSSLLSEKKNTIMIYIVN